MRRHQALAVIGGACLMAAFLAVSPSEATTSDPTFTTPPTVSEMAAMSVRSLFGFDSSIDAVRSTAALDHASTIELGVPITPAEQLEMTSREALGKHASGLDQLFASTPSYAGAWIDQTAGGVLTVAFVGGATPAQEAAARASVGSPVVTRNAAISLQRIQDLSTNIGLDYSRLRAEGIPIVAASDDVMHNTVHVYIEPTPATDIAAKLRALYGEGLDIQEVNPKSTTDQSNRDDRDIRSGPVRFSQ